LRFLPGTAGSVSGSLVRLSVCEPLASDTDDGLTGALGVVSAECCALVMSEIELAEVALQVSSADVVIGASDSSLQDREVRLDGVRVPDPPRTYSSIEWFTVPCPLNSRVIGGYTVPSSVMT
jgi:hypothetical protein